MIKHVVILIGLSLLASTAHAEKRTIYKCWRDGTPSVSTQPEKGSRCTPEHFEDEQKMAKAWEELALHRGTLYTRQQDGKVVYGTRNLPGSEPLFRFNVGEGVISSASKKPSPTPSGSTTFVVKPRWGVFDAQFKQAAKTYRVEEALLRAIAHAESGYQPDAVSPKGAMGVMQLMPDTALLYQVKDPFSVGQSINAGAKHLAYLLRLYEGNKTLTAAAYNAGIGAVKRYKGIPPFLETQEYVRRVNALYLAYKKG